MQYYNELQKFIELKFDFQDLRLNSNVVRLEDLTAEMHKKVKTLALIELSSVLDMHGLEYEKIKRRKFRKRIKSKTILN